MKVVKVAYFNSKEPGSHFKIPGNLQEKHGEILEFCQSRKVGTLNCNDVLFSAR